MARRRGDVVAWQQAAGCQLFGILCTKTNYDLHACRAFAELRRGNLQLCRVTWMAMPGATSLNSPQVALVHCSCQRKIALQGLVDGDAVRQGGWRAADRSGAASGEESSGSDCDSSYEPIQPGESDAKYTQCAFVPRFAVLKLSEWGWGLSCLDARPTLLLVTMFIVRRQRQRQRE